MIRYSSFNLKWFRAFTVQTQACASDHNDLQKEKGESNQNSRKSSLRNSISSANNATGYQTFESNGNQNDTILVSHQDDCVTAPKGGRKIALRDFFTVLALSFHSVFEGLAIGLEPTTDHVILLFAGSIFVMSDFHKRETFHFPTIIT